MIEQVITGVFIVTFCVVVAFHVKKSVKNHSDANHILFKNQVIMDVERRFRQVDTEVQILRGRQGALEKKVLMQNRTVNLNLTTPLPVTQTETPARLTLRENN